jgi:hypothetical protein
MRFSILQASGPSPPTMFFGSAATYISIQSLNICKGSKVSRVSLSTDSHMLIIQSQKRSWGPPAEVEKQTTKCNPNKSYKHSLYYQISLHYGNAPFWSQISITTKVQLGKTHNKNKKKNRRKMLTAALTLILTSPVFWGAKNVFTCVKLIYSAESQIIILGCFRQPWSVV